MTRSVPKKKTLDDKLNFNPVSDKSVCGSIITGIEIIRSKSPVHMSYERDDIPQQLGVQVSHVKLVRLI